MGSDLHDGRRSCRLGCFHHVFKVPNFTCQQLPCPHTVSKCLLGPSVVFGCQLYPAVPLSSWVSAAEGLSCAMPCHSLEDSSLHDMLALKSPVQPFHIALCITIHCPRKLSTYLSRSETFVASAAL